MSEPALLAFRRLLTEAAAGGQSKIDALVALSQRSVLVATWPHSADSYRTLTNSHRLSALPIFSGNDALLEAATRFGWLAPDGSIPHRELDARAALRYAITQSIPFIVIDIASDHALEVEQSEVEPLTVQTGREAAGPFAGVGRISTTLAQAVKSAPAGLELATGENGKLRRTSVVIEPTPPVREETDPAAVAAAGRVSKKSFTSEATDVRNSVPAFAPAGSQRPPTPPPSAPAIAFAETGASSLGVRERVPTPPPRERTATPAPGTPARGRSTVAYDGPIGRRESSTTMPAVRAPTPMRGQPAVVSADGITLTPIRTAPPEALIDALTDVLREYPEVEWAALCTAARAENPPVPAIGLRVDASYRARVATLTEHLKRTATTHGAVLDIVLLDDPATIRKARADAYMFYPWRRK